MQNLYSSIFFICVFNSDVVLHIMLCSARTSGMFLVVQTVRRRCNDSATETKVEIL